MHAQHPTKDDLALTAKLAELILKPIDGVVDFNDNPTVVTTSTQWAGQPEIKYKEYIWRFRVSTPLFEEEGYIAFIDETDRFGWNIVQKAHDLAWQYCLSRWEKLGNEDVINNIWETPLAYWDNKLKEIKNG